MKKITHFFLAMAMISLIAACKKNDPPLPDNLAQFETNQLGFNTEDAQLQVKLTLSRSADIAIPVTISLNTNGVTYGTEFTTEPAAVNNTLTVTIPAGSNTASFQMNKAAGIFLQGDESVSFKIQSVGNPALTGPADSLHVQFSAIISSGSQLKLNGGPGGSAAENSVYVDLSANEQTAVKRDSWDLGFYGGDDFRVILNNTTGATAKATTQNDIRQITTADTAGFSPLLVLGQGQGTFDVIDDVDGDLSKNVIKDVSAVDTDNKVYIIRPNNTTADWYKVKINRSASGGYTLQYAKLSETTIKTIDIPKDANFNFKYASFTTGALANVEPGKAKWDIEWTMATYKYSPTIPYIFSDYVYINYLGGVQVAEVLTSTTSYNDYNETNIANTTFQSDKTVIGGNWRSTSPATGIKTDRFYVVKDVVGNVYKLQFISMGVPEGDGTRGEPVIEYKLVKKG